MIARSSNDGRLRLAVPNKGRLCQPASDLLEEAGVSFEADERRLFASCRNYPIDLLFVRAEDIGEYTQDGVVDLGITGSNLLEERGVAVDRLLPLEFGHCALQLAVPAGGGTERVSDLRGRVIATSHPRTTAAYLRREQVDAQIIEVRGAVEVAPLLGVADAIVDLVSTGTTLATNGLRPLETILESQAELIATPALPPARRELAQTVRLMLASVLAARQRKYLMMNAPATAVEQIRQVLPGLGSPSVMQLADPAMVAIHAVVDAQRIWDLLGPLRDAGASSILVVPIEKMIP